MVVHIRRGFPVLAAFAAALLIVAWLSGCGRAPDPSASSSSPVSQPAPPTPVSAPMPAATRFLVRTFQITLRAQDVHAVVDTLRAAVARNGGYVSDGSESDDDGSWAGNFEARIPVDRVDAYRAEVGRMGEVIMESEHVEDVTDQRADLGARLLNARAQEKRLLELLSSRTGTLADVMLVDKELASVRETIERMEAQQRGLEEQIQFATVHIRLEPKTVAAWQHPGSSVARAAANGVRYAWAFSVGATVVFLSVAPTAGLIGIVALAFVLLIRRFSRARPQLPATRST